MYEASQLTQELAPKSLFPLKMSLVCLAINAALLVYVIYQVALYPASNGSIVGFIPFVAIVSMMANLIVFSLYSKSDSVSGRAAIGWVVGALLWLVLMSQLFPLAMSQVKLTRARANIQGHVPAIAIQASNQLKAQPWNTMAAVTTLRSAVAGTSAASEFSVFQQAARLGVASPSVQRVLANGVVTRDDKEALLTELLANMATHPNAQLLAIANQMRARRSP